MFLQSYLLSYARGHGKPVTLQMQYHSIGRLLTVIYHGDATPKNSIRAAAVNAGFSSLIQ